MEALVTFSSLGVGTVVGAGTLYKLRNTSASDLDSASNGLRGEYAYQGMAIPTSSITLSSALLLMLLWRGMKEPYNIDGLWWMIFIMSLLYVVLASLDIHMVREFDKLDITLNGSNLEGNYVDVVHGVAISSLSVGGLFLLAFLRFTLKGGDRPKLIPVDEPPIEPVKDKKKSMRYL